MAETLYDLDYSQPSSTVKVYIYDVPLPKMPSLKSMANYGLKIGQQKFKPTIIPESILNRKNVLSTEESTFIKNEHHKRHNGVWQIIKGQPIYITGPYYHFLNYHVSEDDTHPEFRYTQCRVYQFWDMVVRMEQCYGVDLVGPRRGGKTEFTLGMVEEYLTRVRSVHCGMQSMNDTAAYENFKRVTHSNKNMIWFMKPISKGSEDPEDKLEFKYPSAVNTSKSIRDQAQKSDTEVVYTEKELGSWLDFQPCKPGAYDRTELDRWIMNEAGKLENMSLLSVWKRVKACLHKKGGKIIVGKAWFETTIEEIDDKQIHEVGVLWANSDPKKLNKNGRTTSGLIHLFLSHEECFEEDEWGFPKIEEARQWLENEIEHLKSEKKYDEIGSLLRQNPRNIEDALTPSGAQSAFNKDRLQDALQRIDYPEKFGFEKKDWGARGNFIWSNGIVDGKVIFIPHHEGKFFVSQLLKDGEDNLQMSVGGIKYPLNVHKFRGGVDPFDFDLKEVIDKNRASKGGGVIMRMYDDNVDGAKILDGSPIDFAWEWQSKQPVCTYLAREDDSRDFFEDMLMMHVYYGTQMLVENNKKVIKNHFRDRGYSEYIMPRPESTMNETARDHNTAQLGAPASTDTIDQYFHAITHYVMVYGNAIKHRDLLLQLLEMNKANRGKLDLGVSFGWALIACDKKYDKLPSQEYEQETQQWFDYQFEDEVL